MLDNFRQISDKKDQCCRTHNSLNVVQKKKNTLVKQLRQTIVLSLSLSLKNKASAKP